ncbi:MAG: hypothetical protein PHF46_01150 [Candidatus Gracilibacteria bacterium]|nr:hypothetical protein [Candidatus Gracilibacteria bacterium]MDD3119997.1 hypothetical protein [Candidatus Gracilibacteria bacterium]MDD4529979.1 hypothetical protein [Candidatus Gracilibacteria bacterium]
MRLGLEIKDFVKKVLLLGILLSVFVNFIFVYIYGFDKLEASAGNDLRFKKAGESFLGTSGVAISLNVGTRLKDTQDIPVNLTQEVLSISSIIGDKGVGRKQFISSNMVAINEYLNVLKTDINSLLDSSIDREAMLSSFIDQLEYRYTNTDERIQVLKAQSAELQGTVNYSNLKINTLKTDLVSAYKNLDYDKTEENFATYIEEKEKNTYANIYLVFTGRFIRSYTILNEYNKQILDALINNKDALVKNVKVVLPSTGTSIIKELKLIETESQYKAESN